MELKLKTLLFDIETTPNLAYVWGTYEQNVIKFKEHSKLLCFSYKWLGEKKIHHESLQDLTELQLVKKLHSLLNSADVVIAHNGNEFDIKKSNTFFIKNNLVPPNDYRKIDTLKIARRYFYFQSNKLDDLGEYLGLGRKIKVDKELWFGCMNGDDNSWNKMIKYCDQDVALLENIYLKLRSWDTNHPRLHTDFDSCVVCGSKNIEMRGFQYTATTKKQRFRCINCGKWGIATKNRFAII